MKMTERESSSASALSTRIANSADRVRRTSAHTRTLAYMHTLACAHAHIHSQTCSARALSRTHACTLAGIRAYTRVCTCACTLTRTHSRALLHAHTLSHTHDGTQSHTSTSRLTHNSSLRTATHTPERTHTHMHQPLFLLHTLLLLYYTSKHLDENFNSCLSSTQEHVIFLRRLN